MAKKITNTRKGQAAGAAAGKASGKGESAAKAEKLVTTARSGKTGATGIIRDTGQNGMIDPAGKAGKTSRKGGSSAKAAAPMAKILKSGPNGKAAGGRKKVPVILITNDDGISAPGIRNLVEAVKGLGKVVVVAPDKPQSGMGHAITIGNPLRLHPMHHIFGEGVEAWQCSGTPVDC